MTLAHQMASQPTVEAFHEGVVVGGRSGQLKYLFQSTDLPKGEEEWNRKALVERLELAEQIHPLRLCESNNTLSMNLDLVQEYFPDAKIIHLVRPPIEQAISRFPAYGAIFRTQKAIRQPPRNRTTWTNVGDSAIWLPHGRLIELAAKVWQLQNETIAKTKLPRITVETRELSSLETWKKILDFCEIDGPIPNLSIVANAGSKKYARGRVPREAVHYCSMYCTWKWK